MKYIKLSGGTLGKWSLASGRRQYSTWTWSECSMVLGSMQQVKVRDKVMNQITLVHSVREYYCRHIHILWKHPHSVDIICISWIYPHFVDTIRIFWISSALAALRATQLVMFVIFFTVSFWLCILFLVTLRSTQLVMTVLSLAFYSSSESDWCIWYLPKCLVWQLFRIMFQLGIF